MNQKQNQHIISLIKEKGAKLVITQSKDDAGQIVPRFITSDNDLRTEEISASELRNFFAYVHKPELKSFGRIGIVVNYFGVKTYLQLAFENQLRNRELILLAPEGDGFFEISEPKQAEEYLSKNPQPSIGVEEELAAVMKMNSSDRWKYWMEKFQACTKCYACRAVCPMCYCASCTTECNNPQWIPVAPSPLGNLEWNIMRAMHLAGRCVGCGECDTVCPVNIPLNIINQSLTNKISDAFGVDDGKTKYALNTFKPEEKVDFIK